MAAYSQIEFTLDYEDATSSKLTIGPFAEDDTALNSVKAKVMMFNANFSSETAKYSLSKYGNLWSGISGAKIITVDKSIIF